MALDLSTLTAQQQVAAIYIGYYDRAADPVGSDFWEAAVANPNLSLADIATDFSTQPETLIAYPFLGDPTEEQANAFIAELYLNLFNRSEVDADGLQFWSDVLLGSIAGTNDMSVGEIILSIIEGAQDTEAGNDRTTILNKIEVSTAWTDAAEAAGFTEDDSYADSPALQNSAKSIIEGVTDEESTVVGAKSTIDNFFEGNEPSVPGNELFLTSGTDVSGLNGLESTDDDDTFYGYMAQNPFAGGVSNSLSSADRLDGEGGNDRLYAELSFEFLGADATGAGATDIQPRSQASKRRYRSAPTNDDTEDGENDLDTIIVDAKNIVGHDEIGSYYSDGDLKIENLTTKETADDGSARNTSEITVTMDHTDNFNSDGDASDLTVLFDNDYLLSGQEAEGKVFYFLLDEDAELVDNPNRLNNIDVDGIRFNITNADGTTTDVTIEAIEANVAGTHQGFVNALQAPLQALIADGTLPAGTTLTLDPTVIDFTFLDDGSRSDEIPAIVLTSGDGSVVEATGFSRIEEEIGEYDVYGRFRSSNEVEDQPISVDLDLHKAGRGGEGGDVVIGGKSENTNEDSIADGIEVINVNVKGAGDNDPDGGMTKPSNVGTITSTGNELRIVNIATDAMFAAGSSYASLTVRNGFDQDTDSNVESGNLELVNADAFLGDLTLGDIDAANNAGRVTNADTITAQGGGDVELGLLYDGTETAQAYSVTTGGGDDSVDVQLDGDALDYAGSSLNVSTGDGNDDINVVFSLNDELGGEDTNPDDTSDDSEQLNQAILDNVTVETGSGNDFINVDGLGNANIKAGAGDDVIFTDGQGDERGQQNAVWAFNFDAVRVDDGGGNIGQYEEDELPGEQTSLAYIGGATVTVILSGANGGSEAGGVMADQEPRGAWPGENGFESSVTIEDLINGNTFYGDQRDINAAVMTAINDDPILSKLLEVRMGPNNTLLVESLTSGNFGQGDLRIEIDQRDLGTEASAWDSVEDEAQAIFSDSGITIGSLAETNINGNANYGAADLTDTNATDTWYDGLSAEDGEYDEGLGDAQQATTDTPGEGEPNRFEQGSNSRAETDNVIDGGAGNDLIVLSTDIKGDSTPDFTVSSNNALLNGASNETIVLTGDNFGDDTIMNFATSRGVEYDVEASDDDGFDPGDPEEGLDFLDFTAYLTSQFDASPDGSTPEGSSDSYNTIQTTLTATAASVDANEVSVVQFATDASDDDETFEALSASDIAALFNDSVSDDNNDDSYGTLTESAFEAVFGQTEDQVVNGDGKAILMVENTDNDGEYKVFELSWNSGGNDTDDNVTVNALGSLDFGDSLDGLTEVNLVGSNDYANLLSTGFDLGS